MHNTEVFKRLEELAKKPYDLTAPSALLVEDRLRKYSAAGPGLRLSYGTQRIDDEVMDALQRLSDECGVTEQFRTMCTGAVLNKIAGYESENRQVLHTACRDIFTESPLEPIVTADVKQQLANLEIFLTDLGTGKIKNGNGEIFTTMVQVGIGGSDLGPRAICESLKAYALPNRKVHFISNVDPGHAREVLAEVDLSRTLFNIVSKSGSTQETQANEEIVRSYLQNAGLDPALHCVAVTAKGSPMDNKENYLECFYLYDCIGGRYSTTSMVGAVILGFQIGFEAVKDFLRGASEMDRHALNPNINENIPLLMALIGIWNHNFLDYDSVAIIPYSQAMRNFPSHLQQCDMESNGKSIDRNGQSLDVKSGPIVWGGAGTNGQHAYFQLFHQGSAVVPVEFIGFVEEQADISDSLASIDSQTKLNSNLLAQSLALAIGRASNNPNKTVAGNKPNLLLAAKKLTPEIMGTILACYEAKIIFQGFAWNINSFDQEGVSLGKDMASKIISKLVETKQDDDSVEALLVDWFLNKGNC